MSEHQYYEFRALDAPLNQRQMDELREMSTRAEITPTSFTNEYHYGDFRGDPEKVLAGYFDAFFYFANWGTHTLMFRLPAELVNVAELKPYCDGEVLALKQVGKYFLLVFESQDEGGDYYDEEDPNLDDLIALRSDIAAGDLRALYLGWLVGLTQSYEEEDDRPEPPVPPGMRALSPSLEALADFLRVDADLLETAARADTGDAPKEPTRQQLADWIAALPEAEKNDLLLQVAEQEAPLLHAQLRNRFRHEHARAAREGAAPPAQSVRRTAAELRAAGEALAEENRRKEAERQAREREKREREKAKKRAAYLDSLAARESEVWREVDTLIATMKPKDYDQAVTLLQDLHDLAERDNRLGPTRALIQQLRERHSGKPSLRKRFDKAGLDFPEAAAGDVTRTSVTRKERS
jgi:hypothetical protein